MRFLPATAVAALALGLLSGSAAFAADGQDRGAQGTQNTQHQNDKNDKGDKNNRGATPRQRDPGRRAEAVELPMNYRGNSGL